MRLRSKAYTNKSKGKDKRSGIFPVLAVVALTAFYLVEGSLICLLSLLYSRINNGQTQTGIFAEVHSDEELWG